MVSQRDFKAYVELQMSGTMNMSDPVFVAATIGARVETVKEIQDNYEELEKQYGSSISGTN